MELSIERLIMRIEAAREVADEMRRANAPDAERASIGDPANEARIALEIADDLLDEAIGQIETVRELLTRTEFVWSFDIEHTQKPERLIVITELARLKTRPFEASSYVDDRFTHRMAFKYGRKSIMPEILDALRLQITTLWAMRYTQRWANRTSDLST